MPLIKPLTRTRLGVIKREPLTPKCLAAIPVACKTMGPPSNFPTNLLKVGRVIGLPSSVLGELQAEILTGNYIIGSTIKCLTPNTNSHSYGTCAIMVVCHSSDNSAHAIRLDNGYLRMGNFLPSYNPLSADPDDRTKRFKEVTMATFLKQFDDEIDVDDDSEVTSIAILAKVLHYHYNLGG